MKQYMASGLAALLLIAGCKTLEITCNSDMLIGSEKVFQLCLGIEGPQSGGKALDGNIDGFNTLPDSEEFFYISNPALGLWAYKEKFKG
ncbi:MAG TPA: hypothetical protein VLL07_00690 [Pontiella sp.]|nr:hypothetical protein [Pontiella sp.]